MAQFTVDTHRFEPVQAIHISYEVDGRYVADICQSQSPQSAQPRLSFTAKGESRVPFRHSPGNTAYEPIILERGVTHDTASEDWATLVHNLQGDAAMSLKNFRKDVVVELLNGAGQIVILYKVYRC